MRRDRGSERSLYKENVPESCRIPLDQDPADVHPSQCAGRALELLAEEEEGKLGALPYLKTCGISPSQNGDVKVIITLGKWDTIC